jgi:RsmE family RNA methyltransferase
MSSAVEFFSRVREHVGDGDRGAPVNLVLLEPTEVGPDGVVVLDGVRAQHLRAVLRVGAGDAVRVGILDGPRGVGTVRSLQERGIRLDCAFDPLTPPRPAIDLLLALPRPKIMRRLWAQLAALGVGRIVLTNAERVERNYFDTHVLTPACYRPLLIEGLQQARDTRLPRVSIHRRLKVLIEDEIDGLFDGGLRIAADPAHGEPISEVIGAERGVRILLAIGPEGGWTEYERTLLAAHGFHPAGLGPRTLRSDTACIALLALAHAARGSGPPPAG